jgi:predicted ATPase
MYFSPFTCIAGANAIGKSNFFDALMFLSHLADNTILQAAKSVRSENQKNADIRDIFFKNGAQYLDEIAFQVDMLIAKTGVDDLGQTATATITSLTYALTLHLNQDGGDAEPIEIIKESLEPIRLGDMRKKIHFECKKEWIESVLDGRRSTSAPFISTKDTIIKLHSDSNKEKKRGGRTTEFIAKKMPRTLLSTVTAESPTAFLVRQEMRNWLMLQFEPSALRQPNSIFEVKNAEITANGLNLPATLYRLHNQKKDIDVYQRLTNKLKDLVEDVKEIKIDKDDKRDLLTLNIQFKGDFSLPAQSLSDGTLRFLGLAIIEEDSSSSGLICLEEPENGINPKKVHQMVELLKNMTTDTSYEIGEDNPFRQVIINTHAPLVVRAVPDESLYLAKAKEIYLEKLGQKVKSTTFTALKETWKTINHLAEPTELGQIMAYLGEDRHTITMIEEKSVMLKPTKRTVAENIRQYKIHFES